MPLLDPEIQKYLYQQQLRGWLNNVAQGLLQAGAGGMSTGPGLLMGLGAGGTTQTDPMQAFALQKYATEAKREERQQKAFDQLFPAAAPGPQMASAAPSGAPGMASAPQAQTPFPRELAVALGPERALDAYAKWMMESGKPEDLKASDLVQVQGPNGPEWVLAEEAAGRQVYEKPEGAASAIGKLQADLDAGRISREQFNQGMAILNKPATEIKISEGDKKGALFTSRMQAASDRLKFLETQFDPASLVEAARGITNITASPEYRQYRQAAREWIAPVLRYESGAAIPETEFESYFKTYFPQAGDDTQTIANKAQARQVIERAMLGTYGTSPGGQESGQPTGGPVPGTVEDGYLFKGGNPADPKNWEKLQ